MSGRFFELFKKHDGVDVKEIYDLSAVHRIVYRIGVPIPDDGLPRPHKPPKLPFNDLIACIKYGASWEFKNGDADRFFNEYQKYTATLGDT